MRWIVESSLRLAAFVAVAIVVLLVLGAVALRHAAVDTLPELQPPHVQVQTEALGLSASEVEQLITVPLEDEFNGIAYLDHLRSQSVPGLSSIELTFKRGTDIYKARQLVTERVAQGPSVVNVGSPPVMIQPLSSESRTVMIGLSSRTTSLIDLSTLARWRIRPRLLAVPGVADVTIWGQRDRQLQVRVDPKRMSALRVTLNQILNTTSDAMWTSPLTFVEASSPGADGFIDTPNQRLSIQHLLPIRMAKDLAQVPIEETAGDTHLTLSQVATVVEDHQPLRGDAALKSGSGLVLVVEKLPGANALAVTRGIDQALRDLKPGLTGVTVDATIFRPATFIRTALGNVGLAALVAFALVIVWLGVATWSWRLALIAALAIAVPVVVTGAVLYIAGATFSTMTLAGLAVALGVIVDDAVVGVLTMRRRLDRQPDLGDQPSRAAVIVTACADVRRPLGYALAILVLAAVPIFLLGDLGASLGRPLAATYLLAVAASTLAALIVTPALGALLLRPGRGRAHLVARWIEHVVSRAMAGFLRRPLGLAAAALLLVAGIAVIPLLRSGALVPAMQDRNLLVRWQAQPGTSLTEMQRTVTAAGKTLSELPAVANVGSNVGQALMGDQIVDVNSAETWITIAPKADYARALTAVRKTLSSLTGLQHSLVTYSQAAVEAAPTDAGPALTVRVYGDDAGPLAAAAQRLRDVVAAESGVAGVRIHSQSKEPAIQVTADIAKAARYGLKPGDIRRQTSVLVAGIAVGSYYRQQQIFDVTVWSIPAVRQSLAAIRGLLLDTPDGRHVALDKVATVAIEPAAAEIDHDQVSRYVDITAVVKGRSLPAVVSDVRRRLQSVTLPLSFHAEVFSAKEQRQSADRRTLLGVIAAIVGALFLLQAAFQRWGRAALLLVTWPLAAVGGLWTALAAGRVLTIGALIGFITVAGIALRNGILLIRRCGRIEREHKTYSAADVVLDSASGTVVPVVLTAVALALAALPFVARGTIAGMEILRPFALVVIGGLVTSTLYSLFVLPALYLHLRRTGSPGGKRRSAAGGPA